jgi:hypothetical protein
VGLPSARSQIRIKNKYIYVREVAEKAGLSAFEAFSLENTVCKWFRLVQC